MSAAVSLSLLSNTREHVVDFGEDLCNTGAVTARGEGGVLDDTGDCISRAVSDNGA